MTANIRQLGVVYGLIQINENMKATDDFKKYLNSILNKVDDEIHNELWNRLIDIIKENELSKLRQGAVIGSYAIVRWHDNNSEDVVCTTKEVAEEYVRKYNALCGKDKCFVDTEIWLPLRDA